MGTAKTPSLTFADPELRACPFAAYDRIREAEPVFKDPVTGNYLITRYDDARKALLNTKVMSSRTGLIHVRENPEADKMYQEHGWLQIETLVNNDPPEHRFYRALVDKIFTVARVTALNPRILEIVTSLIDRIIEQKEIDFLDAFAVKLPLHVLAEQLGVPSKDLAKFKLWSDTSVELVGNVTTPARELEIHGYIIEMQNYLGRIIEEVRVHPNETLISQLTNVEVDGRKLNMRELLGILHQILIAGNETTTTILASSMKLLIDQPPLAERLYREPAFVERFVEESLRIFAPVQVGLRKTTQDVEIRGVTIPAGSIVEVRLGAANRDPLQFAAPAAVDLERKNAQSHMTFGAGPHFCIGSLLARAEVNIAFKELTRRLQGFRASRGADSYEWMTSFIVYGPKRLWMSFDKRAA